MNNKEVTKIYERYKRLRTALTGIKKIIEVALNDDEPTSSSGRTAKHEDIYFQKCERPSDER
tara:strand:+ start:3661 stop:3846 length:186 start_codon:yes stop_codon:yes gene_type:complete